METGLFILSVIVFGVVINVALRQSYNLLFFVARKPLLWIVFVAVLAVSVWALSAAMGWSVSLPAWASTLGLLLNLPPGLSKESTEAVNEIYSEMGMKRGRLLYRTGLATFVLASVASWVMFYGQICSASGECRAIF